MVAIRFIQNASTAASDQASKVPLQFSSSHRLSSQPMSPQGPLLMPIAEHVVRSSSSPLVTPQDKLANIGDPRQAFVSHMASSIRGHDGVHRQRSWAGPSPSLSPCRSLSPSPLQGVPLTSPPQLATPVAQPSPSILLSSSSKVERNRSSPAAAPYSTERDAISESPGEVRPSASSQLFEGGRRSRSCEQPAPPAVCVQTMMDPAVAKLADRHPTKNCEQLHPVSVRRTKSCDQPWIGASGSSSVSPDIGTNRIAATPLPSFLEQRRLIGESLAALVSGALGSGPAECTEVEEIIGEDVSHIEEFQLLFSRQETQGCSPPQADPGRLTAANLACAEVSSSRWCPSGGFVRPHGTFLEALPKVLEGTDSPSSPTRSARTTDSRQPTLLLETAAPSPLLDAECCVATERPGESLKIIPPRTELQLDAALSGINLCLRMAADRAKRQSSKLVGQRQKAEAKNRLLQHKCEGTKGSRRLFEGNPRSSPPTTVSPPHSKERQVAAAAAPKLSDSKANESAFENAPERNDALGAHIVDNVA